MVLILPTANTEGTDEQKRDIERDGNVEEGGMFLSCTLLCDLNLSVSEFFKAADNSLKYSMTMTSHYQAPSEKHISYSYSNRKQIFKLQIKSVVLNHAFFICLDSL